MKLAEAYAESRISEAEWMRARRKLDERATAARVLLRRRERSGALVAYARPGALREAWSGLDQKSRRAVIAAVVEHVTVTPATRRGPVFDPNRVGITWRA